MFHAFLNEGGDVIGQPLTTAAQHLVVYYLRQVRAVREKGAIDPELRQAEELITWLRSKQAQVVCLPDIYTYGPSALRTRVAAEEAVSILIEHGQLIPRDPCICQHINTPSRSQMRKDVYEITYPDAEAC